LEYWKDEGLDDLKAEEVDVLKLCLNVLCISVGEEEYARETLCSEGSEGREDEFDARRKAVAAAMRAAFGDLN
jgi:hypothetical protein